MEDSVVSLHQAFQTLSVILVNVWEYKQHDNKRPQQPNPGSIPASAA